MSNAAATKTLETPVPLRRLASAGRTKVMENLGLVVAFLIILFFAILFVAPVYWMLITSLKSTPEVFQIPPTWWPAEIHWNNYPEALAVFPFPLYVANTLRIAAPVAIGTTISSALVAYGFSRLRWPGRDYVFYL